MILLLNVANATLKQTMVIEIFRHGARSPVQESPWDNWTSYGELTANGAREHYELGLEIAMRYKDLLPSRFDPQLIRVQSTDAHRTIQSVYSQLYGIFSSGDFHSNQEINQTFDFALLNPPFNLSVNTSDLQNQSSALPFGYNPIPVHVTQTKYNYILKGYGTKTCPYLGTLLKYQTNYLFSPENQALLDELQPFVTEAVNNRWIPSIDASSPDALLQATRMYDDLQPGYTSGRTVPFLPGSDHWKGYQYLFEVVTQVLHNSNPLQWQLGSGNFLNLVLEYFKNKTQNLTTYNFLFFSAHDSNLISILTALNQTSVDCFQQKYRNQSYSNPTCVYPTYASSIFFELWTDPSNTSDVRVKVIYNDMVLQLCGQDFCDLKGFAQVIESAVGGLTFSTYLQICNYGLPSTTTSGLDWFMQLALMVVLSFGILINLKIKVFNTIKENCDREVKERPTEKSDLAL